MNDLQKIKNIVLHEQSQHIETTFKGHEVNALMIDVLNSFIEKLDLPDVSGSILAKAEMINALTNTMKVNKEVLGGYHELHNNSLEKLKGIIDTI